MRMSEKFNTDSSCEIVDANIPIINLDDSGEGNILSSSSTMLDTSILKICFQNDALYSELKGVIIQCVKNALFYVQKNAIPTEDPANSTIIFNGSSVVEDDLFIVDSEPSQVPKMSEFVPEYSRSLIVINDKHIEQDNDDNVKSKQTSNTCFNCDGNHSIKDCTKPKDLAKIRENRSKFSSNKLNCERYHADVEQKFSHLMPGELSQDLRSALGLRSNELPIHIYRMRMFGYPPGWLEHAKVSGSGLTMFGSEGKEDDGNTDDDEDKYDLEKIISFPGFNVDPPYGTYDMSNFARAPPMVPGHCKMRMIESLRSAAKSSKRKSIKNTPSNDLPVLTPTNMDIDDESDNDVQNMPLGERVTKSICRESVNTTTSRYLSDNKLKESVIPVTEISLDRQSELSDGEIDDNERENSPTLDDLKERKKRLLYALDDSSVSMSPLTKKPAVDDSLIDDILAIQDDTLLVSSVIDDENGDDSINTPPSSAKLHVETPKSRFVDVGKSPLHSSIEKVCGTPVIKGVSPYTNLPMGEKWAAGVTDVLDFENLPESIGKYEKMRTLLGKVRANLKRIQYRGNNN